MSLEFHTNEELIKELIGRSTFTGLILRSEDEHRSNEQIHQDFEIYSTIHNKADLLSLIEGLSFSLSSELDES
jgi:hypothetical protein